jgi:nucleotide-binding universal stress UspA family protein
LQKKWRQLNPSEQSSDIHLEVIKMFDRVLVAIDVSDAAQEIFEAALVVAKAHQSDLMIVHVLVPTDILYPPVAFFGSLSSIFDDYFEQWHQRETESLEKLEMLQKMGQLEGLSTEITQSIGDPGIKICELAKSWHADAILLGQQGRNSLNKILLGSVSNYVLHHALCNVLTISPHNLQPSPPQAPATACSLPNRP